MDYSTQLPRTPRKKRKVSDDAGSFTADDLLGHIYNADGSRQQAVRMRKLRTRKAAGTHAARGSPSIRSPGLNSPANTPIPATPIPAPDFWTCASAVDPAALELPSACAAWEDQEANVDPDECDSAAGGMAVVDDEQQGTVEEIDEEDDEDIEYEQEYAPEQQGSGQDSSAPEAGKRKGPARVNNTIVSTPTMCHSAPDSPTVQRPSVRFAKFMKHHAQAAHEHLLDQECPPAAGDICAICSAGLQGPTASAGPSERRYRCLDCFGRPHLCLTCTTSSHTLNPFHRVLCWDTELGFWDKRNMTDLGFVLYTGHGGRKCRYAISPRKIIVAHGNGIMPTWVSFCRCGLANAGAENGEARTSGGEARPDDHEALQLIDLGLYPGSWERPQTAFTQDVLRAYILLSFQANMSAQDFYTFLKRRTDNVSPESVPVRSFDMQSHVEMLNGSPGSVSRVHDV